MRSSKQRSRSKSNRPRTLGNITNRVFESSGPDGKVRGTPQQIIEKYLFLARDAQLSNDRVVAEGFLQHAEHYTRMMGEAQRELDARRDGGDWSGGQNDGGDQQGGQNDGQIDSGDRQGDQDGRQYNDRAQNDRAPYDQGQNDRNQNDRNQNDRNQNDRGQNDRGQNDRNRNDRNRNDRNQNDRNQNDRNRNDRTPGERPDTGRGMDDRDQRQPQPVRQADRGPAVPAEDLRSGRGAQRGDSQTGNNRGRRARSSFDEVIDLQEITAEETGLIETPETRLPEGTGSKNRPEPRPEHRTDAGGAETRQAPAAEPSHADSPSAGSGVDQSAAPQEPVKPARKRAAAQRKPHKVAVGDDAADSVDPDDRPNRASAAE